MKFIATVLLVSSIHSFAISQKNEQDSLQWLGVSLEAGVRFKDHRSLSSLLYSRYA